MHQLIHNWHFEMLEWIKTNRLSSDKLQSNIPPNSLIVIVKEIIKYALLRGHRPISGRNWSLTIWLKTYRQQYERKINIQINLMSLIRNHQSPFKELEKREL